MKHSKRPTWNEFWATINGEEWLAAKALLELCDAVRRNASQWLEWTHYMDPIPPRPDLNFAEWVADVDERGRGWSSTEWRIFDIVAALVTPGRPVVLVGTFDLLGSYQIEAWRILVNWGTGGDNRTYPGRAIVTERR